MSANMIWWRKNVQIFLGYVVHILNVGDPSFALTWVCYFFIFCCICDLFLFTSSWLNVLSHNFKNSSSYFLQHFYPTDYFLLLLRKTLDFRSRQCVCLAALANQLPFYLALSKPWPELVQFNLNVACNIYGSQLLAVLLNLQIFSGVSVCLSHSTPYIQTRLLQTFKCSSSNDWG